MFGRLLGEGRQQVETQLLTSLQEVKKIEYN